MSPKSLKRSYVIYLGVIALALCSSAAFGRGNLDKRGFVTEFYQKLLSCDRISIDCLESKGLIRRVSSLLYIVDGARPASKLELDTAIQVTRIHGLPILLCPGIPGLDGVPAADAIVFSESGEAIANLGIKTNLGATRDGTDYAKHALRISRESFKNLLTPEYLADQWGFTFSSEGELAPKKGTPDQAYRRLRILGAYKLFGIGLRPARPAWVAIDLSADRHKSPYILRRQGGVWSSESFSNELSHPFLKVMDKVSAWAPSPKDGIFIDILDERSPSKSRGLISLSLMTTYASDPRLPQQYTLIFNNSYILIDPLGYKIAPFALPADLDCLGEFLSDWD